MLHLAKADLFSFDDNSSETDQTTNESLPVPEEMAADTPGIEQTPNGLQVQWILVPHHHIVSPSITVVSLGGIRVRGEEM